MIDRTGDSVSRTSSRCRPIARSSKQKKKCRGKRVEFARGKGCGRWRISLTRIETCGQSLCRQVIVERAVMRGLFGLRATCARAKASLTVHAKFIGRRIFLEGEPSATHLNARRSLRLRAKRLTHRPLVGRRGGRVSHKSEYLAWKKSASVGCNFARYAALRPDDHGQALATLKGDTAPSLATRIDKHIGRLLTERKATAATLLLPEVSELKTVVQVALQLGTKLAWKVTRTHVTDTAAGHVVAFEVSREIPTNEGGVVASQALVLGNFGVFPPTRRAPLTALELFLGPCPHADPSGNPRTKANLDLLVASMPLGDTEIANMWDRTCELRRKVLGANDDLRAKARVAFVVPLALAREMGCAP